MTPQDRRYSTSHEWVKLVDGIAVMGITDHALKSLGYITYLDFPKPGRSVSAGSEMGVIESTKTASGLHAPIAGSVLAVNDALRDEPERVNRDPYGDGWMVKLSGVDPEQFSALMDGQAYEKMVERISNAPTW